MHPLSRPSVGAAHCCSDPCVGALGGRLMDADLGGQSLPLRSEQTSVGCDPFLR